MMFVGKLQIAWTDSAFLIHPAAIYTLRELDVKGRSITHSHSPALTTLPAYYILVL
jgi:hypothetical protein